MKRSRSSSDRWVESPKRKAVDIEGPESEETLIDPSQLDPRDEEEAKTTVATLPHIHEAYLSMLLILQP